MVNVLKTLETTDDATRFSEAHNSSTYMRPHSECLAMFFNVKAAVSLMCFVTGPSFSSYRTKEGQKCHMKITVNIKPACIYNYSNNCEISSKV